MSVENGAEKEYPGRRVEMQRDQLVERLAVVAGQDGVPINAAERMLKTADETGHVIDTDVFLDAMHESLVFGTAPRADEFREHAITGLLDAYTEARPDRYEALPGQLDNMLAAFRMFDPTTYDAVVKQIEEQAPKREKEREGIKKQRGKAANRKPFLR